MTASVVTIRDVASEAGVAVSTVSRVLNDSGYASPDARGRVLAAADRLGFRPSQMARGLRRARTMTLGMLVPDLANPVFLHHVRGAQHIAHERGYALLICDGQASATVQAEQLDRLYQHRIDGLLLIGPVLAPEAVQPFRDAGVPIAPPAAGDGAAAEPLSLRTESVASRAAFRHLIDLGHRRIAACVRSGGDRPRSQSAATRLRALRMALTEAGHAADAMHVFVADTAAQCSAEVARLSATTEPPTAYVALNHVVAPPLLTALRDAGLRIPEDVSFLTFGDSEWAASYRPAISVVRSDYYREAAASAEYLIARIEQWPESPGRREFVAEFVSRDSCAPAKDPSPDPRVPSPGPSPLR